MDGLEAAFASVEAGSPLVRTCERLTGAPSHSMLCSLRSGRHFIIFRERADEIAILTIIHDASDVAAHLRDVLTEQKEDT